MRILLAFLLTLSSPALAGVEIVDGDTLRVDGERVRAWGFDAPEKRQKCLINGHEERSARRQRRPCTRLWRAASCSARPRTATDMAARSPIAR
jgi:hypothetical protein